MLRFGIESVVNAAIERTRKTEATMLDRLRQETSEEHRRVEALLDLMSPELNLDRYCRILKAFYVAMAPLENAIAEACPARHRGLWEGRSKAWRLQVDLESLNETPNNMPVPVIRMPDLADASLWLGALYVVEGSTLGGQVICRHLERHFGWSHGRGYSYFRGYGERTAERWRQVIQALEAEDADGNLVLKGAHQTFSYFHSCLCAAL